MVEANECQETEVHVDEEPRHPSSSISKEPLDHACDTHGSCRPTRNDDCEPTQRQEERTVATVPLTVSCREDPGNDRVENLSGQTKQNAMTDDDENNSGTTVSGTAPSRCDQIVDEAKRPPPENPTCDSAATPPSRDGESLYPGIAIGENLYPQIFNDAARAHDRLVLISKSMSDSVVTTKQGEERERGHQEEELKGQVFVVEQKSPLQIAEAEASEGVEGDAGADADAGSDAAHSVSIRSWPGASLRGSVSSSRRNRRWQSDYNCNEEEEEKVDEDTMLRRDLAAKERARAKKEKGVAGIGSIIASNKTREKRVERSHPMMMDAYDSTSSSSLVGSMKSVDDKLGEQLSNNMGSIVGHGAFRIGGDDSIEPTRLAHQTAIRVPPPVLDASNPPEGGMCEARVGLNSSGSSGVGLAVDAGADQGDDNDDDDDVVGEAEVMALPTATAWPVDDDVEVGVVIEANDDDDDHGNESTSRFSNGRRGSFGATYSTTKDEDGVDVCLFHLPKRALLVLVCSLLAFAATIGGVLATRKTPASITSDVDENDVSEHGITSEDSLPALDSSPLFVCPSTKLHNKIGRNGDHFGYAIDGKGDTVLIGAHFSNPLGENSGAAYIFRRNQQDNTWFEEAKIYPNDGIAGDKFGVKVALGRSENLAIISADQVGFGKGAVYIYERVDQETKNATMPPWTLQAKLMAEDATEGSQFGDSIAVYDETIVIGASHPDIPITGAVYIFEKDEDSAWVQTDKLVPNDVFTNPYSTESRFGRSVALAGDTLVVGADKDGPSGKFSGSAYIFRREIDSRSGQALWREEAKIFPNDGGESQYFGYDVDIDNSGDTVIVSSWKDGEITKPATEEKAAKTEQIGSVYIFTHDGNLGQWTQQAKITAEDGEPGDRFGNSISINGDGDAILIGAYHDDERRGSAYLFRRGDERDISSWTQTMKLRADDVNAVEEFANQVVLDGVRAIIGENKDGDNSHGYEAGAAHVYEIDHCHDG